jgi:hypothetical protein
MYKRFSLAGLAILALAFSASSADALTIDFDSLQHGEIVDTDFVATFGVEISAVNVSWGPNLAVGFDSTESDTRDPDLEADPFWSGGNIEDEALDIILIIQENDNGCDDGDPGNDGDEDICDCPDDEGSRPAGQLIFDFDALGVPISEFGFDLIDVDGVGSYQENGAVDFLFDGDVLIDQIAFNEFGSQSEGDLEFGDNTANRIDLFDIDDRTTKVVIRLQGSGGVDNITFTPVPEPAIVVIMGLGLVGLAVRGSRRPDRRG